MKDNKYSRFATLNYKKFKELATDADLSPAEKIGFPNEYRDGYDQAILLDIITKCQLNKKKKSAKILDIGSGCGNLIHLFIQFCLDKKYDLFLGDSKEMLDLIEVISPLIHKLSGFWPDEFDEFIEQNQGTFDCVITYSVFHYTFEESNIHQFIEKTLGLLKPNGCFLIGDIPNISMRNRFFASDQGIAFHRNYVGDPNSMPPLNYNKLPLNKIDDGVLLGLMTRYRNGGYNAYILPQATDLPMSNRREDLMIIKI